MHCTSCGVETSGSFCVNCGASNVPSNSENLVAAKSAPQNFVFLIVAIVAGLLALGMGVGGIAKNAEATRFAATAAKEIASAEDFESSAALFDSLARENQDAEDRCYYNPWCSSDTYARWITLTNETEANADQARSDAADAYARANRATSDKEKATSTRNVFFGVAVAAFLGAAVSTILFIRRKQRKPAPLATEVGSI